MKFEFSKNVKWGAMVMALWCGVSTGGAAQGGNSKPAPAAITVTNAAPPKSIFKQPNGPNEGKDPFYPRSVYPYLGTVKEPQATPEPVHQPLVEADLKLGGISGTKEHPLAIINGHTFEAGEEAEVPSAKGKVHVRCLDIKPEGVLVFANGQRRELRLRGGL
jgi:hypothetical protein